MPFENAMKKVVFIGDTCPVCDFKDPSRHFMKELLKVEVIFFCMDSKSSQIPVTCYES